MIYVNIRKKNVKKNVNAERRAGVKSPKDEPSW